MKRNLYSTLLLLAIGHGLALDVMAEETATKDLFDMSLEELHDVRVTVSSHHPEKISETPAIISRYKVDDMAALGLRTLRDILSYIPGLTLQDHLFGQTFVSMRGVYEGFNQKILFLLDDTPYFMPSHSDIPLLGIPLEAISHIEVIRGPGAVYYGTNATGGVIKIVTKDGAKKTANNTNNTSSEDSTQGRITLRGGENAYANLGGFSQINRGKHQLTLAAELQRDEGYKAHYPAYSPNPSSTQFHEGDIDKVEEISSLLLKYRYSELAITGQVFESRYSGIAQPRQVENVNELSYRGYLAAIEDSRHYGIATVKLFADYNRFYPEFLIDEFTSDDDQGGFQMANDGQANYRGRAGTHLTLNFSTQWELFSGLEWEKRSTNEYQMFNNDSGEILGSIMSSFSLQERSFYGQLDYRPNKAWRFSVGGRHTDNSIIGGDTVPRLAAIYQINHQHSIKALYSVGFNTPSFTQLKADFDNVVIGNPDLKPEKLATFDLAYTYTANDSLFTANIFRLKTEDFILSERSSGAIEFFNAGEFSRSGAEFDLQHNIARHIKILSNLSYHHQGNQVKDDDNTLLYVPKLTLNLGASYDINSSHRTGASIRYIGERASAKELWMLNLDYRFRYEKLSIIATLENLSDETIQHPNMAEFNERLVPAGQGRNLKLGLRYTF